MATGYQLSPRPDIHDGADTPVNIWVIMASGPSLHDDDIAAVRTSGCKVAVINRTWERAPWADLLYACDARWWRDYNPGDKFHGEKWTFSSSAAVKLQLQCVSISTQWSDEPSTVYAGGLSGIQAINLIAHRRPDRIVLLGYDCCYAPDGRRHWHADYNESAGFPNVPNLTRQVKNFEVVARGCPVPIINASRVSAIPYFPRMSIGDALR
jgi:hypothetical protein